MFQQLINEVGQFLDRLSLVDYAILFTNTVLFLFARRLLKWLAVDSGDKGFDYKVKIFRALNLLIILALCYQRIFSELDIQSIGFKIVAILIVIYAGILIAQILDFFFRKLYGKQREINGKPHNIETYKSRLLSIIFGVFIFIIVLISIVKIIGFDSLLEAGGVIGFIGVFFALTNSAWAPDIFSGLIILNSRMAEEGDVIELPGEDGCLGVVYKTKLFHTEILNLVNNHRIMFKNAKLREKTIHNLSKFASAKGLREKLVFKVGYSVPAQRVREMFARAHALAVENQLISTDWDKECDVGIIETADYSVNWVIYYYTKDVRNLLRIRLKMNEYILQVANEMGISLATPMQLLKLEGSLAS